MESIASRFFLTWTFETTSVWKQTSLFYGCYLITWYSMTRNGEVLILLLVYASAVNRKRRASVSDQLRLFSTGRYKAGCDVAFWQSVIFRWEARVIYNNYHVRIPIFRRCWAGAWIGDLAHWGNHNNQFIPTDWNCCFIWITWMQFLRIPLHFCIVVIKTH